MNGIKVYNGTNHNVSIYRIDSEHFISNRNGSSYRLINTNVYPQYIFPQKNPLSVLRIPLGNADYNGILVSMPDANSSIDVLHDAKNYDVILVSL